MQDFEETLNICYNKKKLVIQAMDKLGITSAVANLLNIENWELVEIITCDCHDEVLNIKYHQIRLILLAINRTKKIIDAAKELGISERTVHRIIKDEGIIFAYKGKSKHYYIDKEIAKSKKDIIPW